MATKRKHRRLSEITSKLKIDRFFETCRNKYNIYAFQNESKLKIEFLAKMSFPSIVTKEAKRKFFINENELIEDGFIMYFYNFSEELYKDIKNEMLNIFKSSFYVKFLKEDLRHQDKNTFDGKILIKNFKPFYKEETIK